jgi:hypothetical protein
MALEVEDGTGKANAEAYISAADATAYHAARANAAWAAVADDATREAYLRRATDYMAVYRDRWAGWRVSTTQALDWPRYEVPIRDASYAGAQLLAYYPADAVPVQVQRACAELALRAIDGDLNADLAAPVIEETVGPITTKYADGARQSKTFPAIDAMLAPFLDGSGNSLKVKRA